MHALCSACTSSIRQPLSQTFKGFTVSGVKETLISWRTLGAKPACAPRQPATFRRALKRSFQPGGGRAGGASCGSPSSGSVSNRSNAW